MAPQPSTRYFTQNSENYFLAILCVLPRLNLQALWGWCPEPKASDTHSTASGRLELDTLHPSRLGPAPGCAYRCQIRYRSRSDARSWRCVKARLATGTKHILPTQFCPDLKSGSVKPWRPCAKKLKTSLNAVMSWPRQLGIQAAQLNEAHTTPSAVDIGVPAKELSESKPSIMQRKTAQTRKQFQDVAPVFFQLLPKQHQVLAGLAMSSLLSCPASSAATAAAVMVRCSWPRACRPART